MLLQLEFCRKGRKRGNDTKESGFSFLLIFKCMYLAALGLTGSMRDL